MGADTDCPLRPARKVRRSMEFNPLQGEVRRANLDCPRPASASQQPVGGVGILATPGTTQAVLAVQVVGPLHTTANGSGFAHF